MVNLYLANRGGRPAVRLPKKAGLTRGRVLQHDSEYSTSGACWVYLHVQQQQRGECGRMRDQFRRVMPVKRIEHVMQQIHVQRRAFYI
jgi:hypothetical protein